MSTFESKLQSHQRSSTSSNDANIDFRFIKSQQGRILVLFRGHVFNRRSAPRRDGVWVFRCKASMTSFEKDRQKRCPITLSKI